MPIVFICQKVSLGVLLSICLTFCQFQPGVAYKKKKACSGAYCRKAFIMLKISHNASTYIKTFNLPLKKSFDKYLIIAHPRGGIPLTYLIPREKFSEKIAPGKTLLPENNLQGIKLPFRKFRLYFMPNMLGWTIRHHNLEELLTVGCC